VVTVDTSLPSQLWSLIKPRIVALLCLTGLSATLAAGGLAPVELVAFAVAGACIAAGSAALNCWYDRDLDRQMERTADRPLPSGDLDHRLAFAFAGTLLAVGTTVGLLALPAASVGYMLAGVASYVGLYTVVLKRRHWLGVVLGGSAGSFPVLAGWQAVEPVGVEAVAMAALVFVWTPAHAWALAYVYRDDFRAADVPTLGAIASVDRVKAATWRWALLTVAVAAVPLVFGSAVYAVVFALGAPLLLLAFRQFEQQGTEQAAVRAFFTSNLFLAVCFLAWGLDGILTGPTRLTVAVLALSVPWLFVRMWEARPELRGVPAAFGGEWEPLVTRLRPATGPDATEG
jgi:protoheme IX farnesyltransferase